MLWINGLHAENLIPGDAVPAYRDDHTYTFDVNAPGGRLTFGVGDTGTGDNTGAYTITISTLCQEPPPPVEPKTLIFVSRARSVALYGETAAASVMSKLDELEASPIVSGTVVQVENDPATAAAYTAWLADPQNAAKANAVAEAIRAQALARWSDKLEYVVIVGGDTVIPFRRTVDRTRVPDEHTLTDDYYVDRTPIVWQGHEVYIPDLDFETLALQRAIVTQGGVVTVRSLHRVYLPVVVK